LSPCIIVGTHTHTHTLNERSVKAGVLKHVGAWYPLQGKKMSEDPLHIYNSD